MESISIHIPDVAFNEDFLIIYKGENDEVFTIKTSKN